MADAYEVKPQPMLIAMMGLPRSGKSTIATKLAEELGAPIVCKDTIRLAMHGQRYAREAEDYIRAVAKTMIKALFLRGHAIVIADETHYSKAARQSLHDPMWDIRWYPVQTPADICSERAIATGQPDLVDVINEMSMRYEPLEDSDQLYKGYRRNVTGLCECDRCGNFHNTD